LLIPKKIQMKNSIQSKLSFFILSIVTLFLVSCETGGSEEVTIGSQTWMIKNLNVDKFRNGDPVPEAKSIEEWINACENEQPAWCYYGNDPSLGNQYGKIYNWYAVNDPRGISPEGWRIPGQGDWTILIDYLGGKDVAGKMMKSENIWEGGGKGNNESGFSALPGGFRTSEGFNFIGGSGFWWSSLEINNSVVEGYQLQYFESIYTVLSPKNNRGMSIRCIKD